jgi:predicted pyridoxine 5'-phosphate oxidase superfamily flavin-nucleotide-binding protein
VHTPDDPSPFHDGERAVQSRVGVREQMEAIGQRIVRDHMPDQHRELFARLPLLFLGSLDAEGRPWASVVTGPPGFVSTPDARTMRIAARPARGDPADANLTAGMPIGVLGIQLETRRRNRMNGTITGASEHGLEVRVRQSFGNCPKYIQSRAPHFVDSDTPRATAEGPRLSARAVAMISGADTFFIASASREAHAKSGGEGVDVSHRGGKPGFVRVDRSGSGGESVLAWPDFAGNNLFNTLGNIEANPRAGLLFVDFETGDLLTLTCDASIVWNGPEVTRFEGAERVLHARVVRGAFVERAVPLRSAPPERARELARTGSW